MGICFDLKKNNKMVRLKKDKNRLKNNLLSKKGKIISAKNEINQNNSFVEKIKGNISLERKEIINIIKTKRRKNTNLSVDNNHTARKNNHNYDINSDKKSSFDVSRIDRFI